MYQPAQLTQLDLCQGKHDKTTMCQNHVLTEMHIQLC